MTPALSPPQGLLLDLFSTEKAVTRERTSTLREADWQTLLALARIHRIGPMLHWRQQNEGAGSMLPEMVRVEWANAFQAASLRSLRLQGELLHMHKVLDAGGIAHVALKGAFLAFHAYPQPGLRPMRDLDLLVKREHALKAYELLLSAGLTRPENSRGTADVHMAVTNELPPLQSPSGEVVVELHCGLFDPRRKPGGPPDPADTPQFWERCIRAPIGREIVHFESPTDLLFHLVKHAVYQHEFDNGPLTLSDVTFLLRSQSIEWPLFWHIANTENNVKGCLLVLAMAEQFFGKLPVSWPAIGKPEPSAIQEPTALACTLMLRDFRNGADLNLERELAAGRSTSGKLGVLLSKLFPPRRQIALSYPVAEQSWRVFLWYPVKWWHLASRRLPGFLRTRKTGTLSDHGRQLAKLGDWLQEAPDGRQ